MIANLVNCSLRGMKGLEVHFIMRGDTQTAFKEAHYLALRYDLSHAYDVNGTCFFNNLINFIVNGRK